MLIAVDTGGTKTLVTSFSRDGSAGREIRFPTPKHEDDYLAALTETIQEILGTKAATAIVVGVPGVIRNNVVLWGGGNLKWEKFALADPLHHAFGCPVWIENDANLAGLAEARALRDTPEVCLYVTISTGIGTGLIVNNRIAPAFSDSEGGHMLVEYDGRLRQWERFASGKAIYRTYGKFARDITSQAVWRQIADKISRGFVAIIPLLQPDVIIIGGSIGTYFDRYYPTLKKILSNRLPDHIRLPDIKQASHPEEAVLYGCYYYGKDQLAGI